MCYHCVCVCVFMVSPASSWLSVYRPADTCGDSRRHQDPLRIHQWQDGAFLINSVWSCRCIQPHWHSERERERHQSERKGRVLESRVKSVCSFHEENFKNDVSKCLWLIWALIRNSKWVLKYKQLHKWLVHSLYMFSAAQRGMYSFIFRTFYSETSGLRSDKVWRKCILDPY